MNEIDGELRRILTGLAGGIFPLNDWILSKKYVPPAASTLPWRQQNAALTPEWIGAIGFLEHLIKGNDHSAALNRRWKELRSEPLQFSPHDDPRGWRAKRGLGPPSFGVVASGNVFVTNANGDPVTHAEFYAPYWQPLRTTVAAIGTPAWSDLAKNLYLGQCQQWPKDAPDSKLFMIRLGRDLLYAMLGMKNTKVSQPLGTALLIELGETRRVGNRFDAQDAAQAVSTFDQVLHGVPSGGER